MKLPENLAPRRVVVLRPRGLGDIVLSSAVIDALSRAWPRASLEYVAEAPARALLEPDARLHRIFLLGPRIAGTERIAGGGFAAALTWLRSNRPEAVFDLFSNPKTALLAALSGAPWRIGYDRAARRMAYNVRIRRFDGSAAADTRWAGEVQIDFLRRAGVRWEGTARPSVALTGEDRDAAARIVRELGYAEPSRFGAVLPGGTWEGKRWTVEGFVAAGREIARRFAAPALVLWGPPEREDAARIARELGDAGRLAPPTALRVMAALLARSRLLVAPDCLGRHLAIVQGVPTIGVFGTTDPKDWTPPGGLHRTVRATTGTRGVSLRELPPDRVVAEIEALFARNDPG